MTVSIVKLLELHESTILNITSIITTSNFNSFTNFKELYDEVDTVYSLFKSQHTGEEKFYKTEFGSKISHFLHEYNGGCSLVANNFELLKRHTDFNIEKIEGVIGRIEIGKQRMIDSIIYLQENLVV